MAAAMDLLVRFPCRNTAISPVAQNWKACKRAGTLLQAVPIPVAGTSVFSAQNARQSLYLRPSKCFGSFLFLSVFPALRPAFSFKEKPGSLKSSKRLGWIYVLSGF